MTVEAYNKRAKELKDKKTRCMHLDFRGQQPIDGLKIEVFEIEVTEDSFKWQEKWSKNDKDKWVKERKICDWERNFILLIGEYCGVTTDLPTISKGGNSITATTIARRLIPAGNKIAEPALYEFDSEARIDVTYWDEIVKHPDDPDKRSYPTEAHKNRAIAQLKVHGGSKSDSGTEKRAIRKLLKIPDATKHEYKGMIIFCFRCIPDMTNPEVRQGFLNSLNPANAVYGPPRIEHKPDDIIQPAEQPGNPDTTDMDIEMCIDLTRQELKDSPAIYKLAGIILDKKIELEKFRTYIDSYTGLPGEKKISTLVGWISNVEDVEEEFITGTSTVQKLFLQSWGSK